LKLRFNDAGAWARLTSAPTSARNLPLKIRDSHLPAFSSNPRHTPRAYLTLRLRTILTFLRHAFTSLPLYCLVRHLYQPFYTLHPPERVESLIFFDRHLLRSQQSEVQHCGRTEPLLADRSTTSRRESRDDHNTMPLFHRNPTF
jgi:hypothetical protein